MINQELQQKIVKGFSYHKLVGDVVFSDDEYANLLEFTQKLCERYSWSYIGAVDINAKYQIFSTLVEIAKRWHNANSTGDDDQSGENGGYWDYVYKVLQTTNSAKAYQFLTGVIDECSSKIAVAKGLFRKWYYATVLMHAHSPSNSLFSFFDLCYNIYKNDLDFNYSKVEDSNILSFICNRFTEIMRDGKVGDDDNISIGSGVYSIKVGLRAIALHADLKPEFLMLIERVIGNIHRMFHHEQPVQKNFYFESLINEWWKKKTTEISSDRKVSKGIGWVVDRQNISARYARDDSKVSIGIPAIRLQDKNSNPWITIYSGRTQLVSQEMRTRRNEFTITTSPISFTLTELLHQVESIDLRVEISCGSEVIWDSKTSLYRQLILFKDDNEIVKNINVPSNYFAFTYVPDELFSSLHGAGINRYGDNLYNIYPKSGDTITSRYRTIYFAEKIKASEQDNDIQILGAVNNVFWTFGENSAAVFSSQPKLLVSEAIHLSGIEVRIGGSFCGYLDKLPRKNIDQSFLFELPNVLLNGLITEVEIYSHKKEQALFKERVAVFDGIEAQFNSNYYYGDGEMSFSVRYDGKEDSKCFTHQDELLNIDFLGGFLSAEIPWLKWRIDDGEWHNKPDKQIHWYKETIKNNGTVFEIDAPFDFSDFKVYAIGLDKGGRPIESILGSDKNNYQIGRTVYSIGEFENVFILSNGDSKRFELCWLSTKQRFTKLPLEYIDGKVFWTPEGNFVGESNTEFCVELHSGQNVFTIDSLSINNTEIVREITQGVYEAFIFCKSKNIFVKDKKQLFCGSFVVGKVEIFRFMHKEIRIAEVYGKDLCEKPSVIYGIDRLKYFEDSEGIGYYSGSLFFIDKLKQKRYLDSMKNGLYGFERTNPVRIEMRTENTFWLVAGYKNEKDFLGELLFDKSNKQICNVNSVNNKNIVCIDYYRFTEVKGV